MHYSVCSKDCPNMCSLRVTTENGKVIKVEGRAECPYSKGFICAKGLDYPKIVNHPDRLKTPMKRIGNRGSGEFREITWEEAIDTLWEKLESCKKKYGTESVLYLSMSGCFGELQPFAYGFWSQYGKISETFGGLCTPAGHAAIRRTYGEIKHNDVSDFENAKLIILWSKNPAITDIKAMKYINLAIQKGAKLVTIDPRRNESSAKSVLHLSPKPGTDGLLALGLANLIREKDLLDKPFLESYGHGLEEFLNHLDGISLSYVTQTTGISTKELNALVELIEETPKYALFCGSGLQRYSNGGQTVRAISLLPPLTASLGVKGAGFYFDNVQIPKLKWPYPLNGSYETRKALPIGMLAEQLNDAEHPKIKFLWIEKGNPVVSVPNSNKLIQQFSDMDFIVTLDLFMTDTAKHSDLVLPVLSIFEHADIVKSYGHNYLNYREKIIEPMYECKSEEDIFRLLGEKFGFDKQFLPESDDQILRDLLKANNMETTLEEMRQKPYLYPGSQKIAFSDFIFKTDSGKIEFSCESLSTSFHINNLPEYVPLGESAESTPEIYEKYPLQLLSAHSAEKINSQQMRLKDHCEILKKRVIFINPHDAMERNIVTGMDIKIWNDRGEIRGCAEVTDHVIKGVLAMFAGDADHTGAMVNKLAKGVNTDLGNGASYHGYLVEIQSV